MCIMAADVPSRPEENIGLLETEVEEVVSCPVWVLGTKSGPLLEQDSLLTERVSDSCSSSVVTS